ncbi:assimilatory sulfite reductase [Amylocystis lapponica]|nr:assimilatory sulfite reductase [Amylocystis lapponica]
MAIETSGASTPLSSTTTLSGPPSPKTRSVPDALLPKLAQGPLVPASTVIEYIASRSSSSSSVFVYDLAEQVGFGPHKVMGRHQQWDRFRRESADSSRCRPEPRRETVAGIEQGCCQGCGSHCIHHSYRSRGHGAVAVLPSTCYCYGRLIIQVPTVTPVGESFSLSPTLAPFVPALALLPETFTVFLSASPQEAVDLATLSYKLTDTHVIHLFDHHSSTRETGHVITPAVPVQEAGLTANEGLAKAGYSVFDYVGDQDAHTVVVLLNGPLSLAAKTLSASVSGLGVVVVRMLRPWDEDAFRRVLPPSVKHIHILDEVPTQAAQGPLYMDVFATVLDPLNPGPVVKSHRIIPSLTQEYLKKPSTFVDFLCDLAATVAPSAWLNSPNLRKLLFFNTPGSPLAPLPRLVEQTFLSHRSISSRLLTDHDVFSKPGGVTADRLVLSPANEGIQSIPVSIALPLTASTDGEANFLAILDQTLLKTHSVVAHAAPGSPVLLVTSWTPEELVSNLPPEVIALMHKKNLRICTIHTKELAAALAGDAESPLSTLENVLVHLALLRLYLGHAATEDAVLKITRTTFGATVEGIELAKIGTWAWNGLVEVEILPPSDNSDVESAKPAALKDFSFNAIAVETWEGETVVNGARLGSWHDAAKHIIFPSAFTPPGISAAAYAQDPSLRPEVPERTFLVTCTVNRRLTPEDYDRNVFHLEFDTRGTGLKYEIGEALGVHGWNDTQEVLDFCAWYGIDPDRLITIPVPGTDGSRMHTRTVFQALQQQIDLFGKPGKAFYTDLAEYATAQTDKYSLRFIGAPEGVSTFKKLSEKDTVTFADVLKRYGSARPGVEILCEIVGDIKPRHYSIASAQSVVGDRVDLLVVSVDWVTPSGSPRYGQCTRYLAGLKVGQKVTVSTRPSVMKLPPDNLQPIILAGLGTGAAPFRAFLQHRAHLAAQGVAVGPTYYYFGSRHQAQEYLYGEEIEAFVLDGTITRAGLAFSRDGPRKVYIQHLMREDAAALAQMLWDEKGVFYLCGPTWPVPDVYEALVDALGVHTGMERVEAGAFLEGLKGEERYVLEVY